MSVPPRRNKPQRRPSDQDGNTPHSADESLEDTVGEEGLGDDTLDADEWEPVPTRQERSSPPEPPPFGDESDWKTGPTQPPGADATAQTPGSGSGSGSGSGDTARPDSAPSRSSGSRKSITSPSSAPYVPGADKVESRLPAGSMLGGRFEVLRQLGKGGMGEVFLVRDHQIEQREVALKLVRAKWSQNAKFRELFFQEIRSAQKFVSPHVVQVRDCGQLPDGQLFLTMDYVAGESLSQLLRREKNLSTKHALEVTRQLLMGLSSGHEHGFIHRDVKPGNLMLSARVLKTSDNPFGVKAGLLDFGLAALSAELEAERGPGTPHYMSPEQAMGQRLDARSDLFAVGIVLYEMLAGKRPFSGRTQKEVITSVIETDPSPLIDNLEGVKKPIKKLLRKALQKEREKRFSSAADFLKAIDHLGPLQAEEGAPKAMTGIAAVASIAAVGLGGMFFNERISKKAADEQFQSERIQFANSSDQLSNKQAELAQVRGEVERLRKASKAATEDATTPLIEERDAQRVVIKDLTASLAEATEKIRSMGDANVALKGELVDDGVTKDRQKIVYNSLRIGSFRQIQDLLDLIPEANDLQGQELTQYGDLFDRLTARVIEQAQPESNVAKLKLNARGPNVIEVPGLRYLAQVEALANEVGRLLLRGDRVTAKELKTARTTLSELSQQFTIETFRRSTTSSRKDTFDTGRWLGVKNLSREELDERFWSRVENDVRTFEKELLAKAEEQVKEKIEESIPDEDERAREFLGLLRRYGGTGGLDRILFDFHKDAALETTRIEALNTTFGKLEERLQRVQEAIDAGAAAIATQALGESDLRAQASLIQKFASQVASMDAPEIPELLSSCAKRCESTVIAGGNLDMSALTQLPYEVGDLVDLVSADLTERAEGDLAAPLRDLQWFVFAKRWYGSAVPTDLGSNAPAWMKRFAEDLSAAPTDSFGAGTWKEILAFQVQLAKVCVGPPQADRATATYLVQPRGTKQHWERLAVTTDAGEKLLTTTEFIGGSTKRQNPVGGPSVGSSSFIWDTRRLIPFQGRIQSPEFVLWTPPDDSQWEAMRKVRGTELASLSGSGRLQAILRDAYREIPQGAPQYRCLSIVQEDGTKYLVHPVLGVVKKIKTARNKTTITVERDLIHVHQSN